VVVELGARELEDVGGLELGLPLALLAAVPVLVPPAVPVLDRYQRGVEGVEDVVEAVHAVGALPLPPPDYQLLSEELGLLIARLPILP
jgi:hypothetical protein